MGKKENQVKFSCSQSENRGCQILSVVNISISYNQLKSVKAQQFWTLDKFVQSPVISLGVVEIIAETNFMPSASTEHQQTAMFGMGFGICSPIILSLVTSRATQEYWVTVIAVNGTFANLGRIVGPMLMGVVLSIDGISGVFYAGAGIAIATFVIFGYCSRRR